MKKKKFIVAVSGGFDPFHLSYLKLFQEAKKLGDKLVVILNNENWLKAKKGYVFMPQKDRKALIESIKWVDKVILTKHHRHPKDMSVSQELLKLTPDIFANSGDRIRKNIPEVKICKKIDCKIVFDVDGKKINSSS